MNIVFAVFFVIFALVAAYFLAGNGAGFILGKNAKDENGKPLYREQALSRSIGLAVAGLSVSALLGFLGYTLKGVGWLIYVALVLFVVCMIAVLAIVSGVEKYKITRRKHRYRED